jgi:hypothetical protein
VVRFSVGATDFSLLQIVHFVSGAKPFPVEWIPLVLSHRLKRPERKFDHSLLSSVEVKSGWAYAAALHHGLHGMHGENSAILILFSQI